MYNDRLKSQFSVALTPFDGFLQFINPNLVTITGVLSILVYAILFVEGFRLLSIVFLIFGVLCDVFDGAISRKRQLQSLFGNALDGLADRLNDIIIASSLIITKFVQIQVGLIILCALLLLPYLRVSFERYSIKIGYRLFERVETLFLIILTISLSPWIPFLWIGEIYFMIAMGLTTSFIRSTLIGFSSLRSTNFSVPPPKDPVTSTLDDDYRYTQQHIAT